jgi:hypothetical protein
MIVREWYYRWRVYIVGVQRDIRISRLESKINSLFDKRADALRMSLYLEGRYKILESTLDNELKFLEGHLASIKEGLESDHSYFNNKL